VGTVFGKAELVISMPFYLKDTICAISGRKVTVVGDAGTLVAIVALKLEILIIKTLRELIPPSVPIEILQVATKKLVTRQESIR
jgi:hypothetical protein